MRIVASTIVLLAATIGAPNVGFPAWDDRPATQRAAATAAAAAANVVPIASAFVAPRCLQGYILCKLSFAGLSLVAAGEQLFFSGGSDVAQTKAILHRGFAGDWILTGEHVAGDAEPQVLPDPGPATAATP
jgi:hypothetical protein